jgi:hypothetical protein
MRCELLVSSLFAAACSVGEIASDGGGGGSACVDRIMPAGEAHVHAAGGGTNAGVACVVSGCHLDSGPGTGAPGFQFAGTLYKPGGTAPSAGAVIRIKSSAGIEVKGYTDSDGNFNISAGALANPFPATTNATACPTSTPMVGALTTGGGNCNADGCHASNLRITLADQ